MKNWKYPLLSGLLILSCESFAQESSTHPLLSEDWLIRIGGQSMDANVKIGLGNPNLGTIPIVDLKEGDSNTSVNSFWTNIIWQAPERWSFGLSYYLASADTENAQVYANRFNTAAPGILSARWARTCAMSINRPTF